MYNSTIIDISDPYRLKLFVQMDGGELLARPQSPPVLACDYTDLLMQRLKAQKTEQVCLNTTSL